MKTRLYPSRGGFSLIEVTMALGVVSFCLLPLMALLPVSLNTSHNSVEKTAAMSLANAIASDIRGSAEIQTSTSSQSLTTSAAYGFNAKSATAQTLCFSEGGNTTGIIGAAPITTGTTPSRYKATVQFITPSAGASPVTIVRILMTWPATASTTSSTISAVEIVTAIASTP